MMDENIYPTIIAKSIIGCHRVKTQHKRISLLKKLCGSFLWGAIFATSNFAAHRS
jgi:hypothetical protein